MVIIPIHIDNQWVYGCLDTTDNICYTNDATTSDGRYNKIKGLGNGFRIILRNVLGLDIKQQQASEESNTFLDIKGDCGLEVLYLIFNQFYDKSVNSGSFKEKILWILLKLIEVE